MLDRKARSQTEAENRQLYKNANQKAVFPDDESTRRSMLTIDAAEQQHTEDSSTSKAAKVASSNQ